MYKLFFVSIATLFISTPVLAMITVSADRTPAVIDESFQLVFSSDKNISVTPDFSPLEKSLTILNRSNQSSTQIINGRMSTSQKWVLTVLPNKIGDIVIPAINFGNETSPVSTIKVVANASAGKSSNTDDIFVEVSVDQRAPYVQAQVLYTVKLFRALNTTNSSLSDPEIIGGQTVINLLGDDKSYQVQRSGRRYSVIERQYAVFPQNSGELTIDPIVFKGQTGTAGFFRYDPFGPSGKTIVRRSEAISLTVKPIPDGFTGSNWLPASQLSIQEQWSVAPDKLIEGEAVTRTLVINAQGLAASQIPEITDTIPDGLKQYPDQPKFEESPSATGLAGTRKQKLALIPTKSGVITLPAVKLPWWNTQTDTMEIAELPERTLTVKAAAMQQQTPVNNLPQQDILVGDTDDQVASTSTVDNGKQIETTESLIWKLLSLIFFLLWLLTMLLWIQARKKTPDKVSARQTQTTKKQDYTKLLKQACDQNNAAEARQALTHWANQRWPDKRFTSLSQLKVLANPEFQTALQALDSVLYGKQDTDWNGKQFFQQFSSASFNEQQPTHTQGKLEPLYKL